MKIHVPTNNPYPKNSILLACTEVANNLDTDVEYDFHGDHHGRYRELLILCHGYCSSVAMRTHDKFKISSDDAVVEIACDHFCTMTNNVFLKYELTGEACLFAFCVLANHILETIVEW